MVNGYIKVSRELLNNPWVNKDPDHLAVMIYLLKEAAYAEHTVVLGDKEITLKPGQLVTGREKVSRCTGVQADKVGRILKRFENAQLIAQQMHNKGRLISLLFGDVESETAQQDTQQMHSNCTTNAQQLHTTEERKKGIKEEGNKDLGVSIDTPCPSSEARKPSEDIAEVVRLWNTLPSYIPKVSKINRSTQRYAMVNKRLADYSLDDFRKAIENVSHSPWLLGENNHGWHIDFDWFIRPNNFPKVLEGKYLDASARAAPEPEEPDGYADYFNRVYEEQQRKQA